MSASAPPTGRNTPPAKKTIPPETEDRIAALPGEKVGDQRRGGDDDPGDGDAEQRAAHEDRCERIEDVPSAAGRGSAPERAEQQCSPAVLVGDDPRERASQSDTQCRDRDEKPHEEPDVRGGRRVRFDRR
jgi:hypothetical protein